MCIRIEVQKHESAYLEVTDEGESWSIQAVKIAAVRSGDVAACWPFVFAIPRSWPSDQLLELLTWSEPSVPLAVHRHCRYTRTVTDPWACFSRDPKISD
jgi:hypothetical protein